MINWQMDDCNYALQVCLLAYNKFCLITIPDEPCENHFLAVWESFAVMKPMFSFFLIVFIASTVCLPQKKRCSPIYLWRARSLYLTRLCLHFVGDLKHQLLEDKEVINHLHGRRTELKNVSEDRVRKQLPSFTL